MFHSDTICRICRVCRWQNNLCYLGLPRSTSKHEFLHDYARYTGRRGCCASRMVRWPGRQKEEARKRGSRCGTPSRRSHRINQERRRKRKNYKGSTDIGSDSSKEQRVDCVHLADAKQKQNLASLLTTMLASDPCYKSTLYLRLESLQR